MGQSLGIATNQLAMPPGGGWGAKLEPFVKSEQNKRGRAHEPQSDWHSLRNGKLSTN